MEAWPQTQQCPFTDGHTLSPFHKRHVASGPQPVPPARQDDRRLRTTKPQADLEMLTCG